MVNFSANRIRATNQISGNFETPMVGVGWGYKEFSKVIMNYSRLLLSYRCGAFLESFIEVKQDDDNLRE